MMLGRNRRRIRTALGLHPQLAHERFRELPLFEALLGETRYVGEIGLDGSPAHRQHADIQRKVFERALAASRDLGGASSASIVAARRTPSSLPCGNTAAPTLPFCIGSPGHRRSCRQRSPLDAGSQWGRPCSAVRMAEASLRGCPVIGCLPKPTAHSQNAEDTRLRLSMCATRSSSLRGYGR